MTQQESQLYLQRLSERIKSLRKSKGLTQNDLGVEDRTIRRIESNTENYNPSFLVLVEIASTLNMTVSELLHFED